MANDIDERVVKLTFDNTQFEIAARQSIETLKNLKEALNFNNVDISNLNKVVEAINKINFSIASKNAQSLDKSLSFKEADDTNLKKIDSTVEDMDLKSKKQEADELDESLQFKKADGKKVDSVNDSVKKLDTKNKKKETDELDDSLQFKKANGKNVDSVNDSVKKLDTKGKKQEVDELDESLQFKKANGKNVDSVNESVKKLDTKNKKKEADELDESLQFKKANGKNVDSVNSSVKKLDTKGKKQEAEALDEALQFKKADATKIENVNKSLNQTAFQPAIDGVKSLEDRFSTLGIVGMTVISNLTTSLMDMAGSMLTAIPNQMIGGAINRASGIKQAKFQIEGLKNVSWEKISEDIDYGVKDTAYSFDAAAKAASMFAASGIQAGDDMKAALRGVSGVAAMTNQSYETISDIFSTVAGTGALMGNDITRLGFYGMNAAATMADYFKEHAEQYQYLFDQTSKFQGKKMSDITEGDVRDLASERVIDFKTFATAMNDAFGQHAKDANKTFAGALANVKAALARTWVDVASAGFDSSRDILNAFRDIVNKFNGLVKPISNTLSKVFEEVGSSVSGFFNGISEKMDSEDIKKKFEDFGNTFSWVVDGIKKGVSLILPVISSIGGVFSSVFSGLITPTISKIMGFISGLNDTGIFDSIANNFSSFFNSIKGAVDAVAPHIQNILSILGGPLSKIAHTLLTVFSNVIKMASGIVQALTPILENIVGIIEGFISTIVGFISPLLDATSSITEGVSEGFGNLFSRLREIFSGADDLFGMIRSSFEQFKEIAKQAWDKISWEEFFKERQAYNGVKDFFKEMGRFLNDALRDGVGQIDFKGIFDGIINGLKDTVSSVASAIADAVRSIGSSGLDLVSKIIDLVIEKIRTIALIWDQISVTVIGWRIANGLTGFATSIMNGMKAIALLPVKIGAVLTSIKNTFNSASILMLAIALVQIGTAIKTIGEVIKDIGSMDYESLIKGTVVVGLILGAFLALVYMFTKADSDGLEMFDFGKLSGMAWAISQFGSAISTIANAIKDLSTLQPDTLVIGIIGLAAVVAALVVCIRALQNAGKNVDMAGSLATVAMLIVITYSIKSLMGAIATLANSPVEGIFASLAAFIVIVISLIAFVKTISTMKINIGKSIGVLLSLIAIAVALKMVMSSFTDLVKAVSESNSNAVALAIVSLVAVVGILIGSLAAISAISKKFNPFVVQAAAYSLLIASASIKVIAGALVSLKDLTPDQAMTGALGVTLILAALTAAMGALAKISQGNIYSFRKVNLTGIAFSLLVASAAIKLIASALGSLANMSVGGLFAAAGSISVVVSVLTAAIAALAGIQNQFKRVNLIGIALTLTVAAGAIKKIAASIALLADFDAGNIFAAAGGISIVLAVLTASIAVLANVMNNIKVSKIAALCEVLIIFSFAVGHLISVITRSISTLADYPVANVAVAAASLAGVLIVLIASFTAFIAVVDKLNISTGKMLGSAAALLIVGMALGQIAGAIATVSAAASNAGALAAGVAALLVVFGVALGAVVLLASKAGGSAPDVLMASVSLLVLGFALGALAGALASLASVPSVENLVPATIAITIVLYGLVGAVIILGQFAQKSSIKLMAASLALYIVAHALSSIALALSFLANGPGDPAKLIASAVALSILLVALAVALTTVASGLRGLQALNFQEAGNVAMKLITIGIAIALVAAAMLILVVALRLLMSITNNLGDTAALVLTFAGLIAVFTAAIIILTEVLSPVVVQAVLLGGVAIIFAAALYILAQALMVAAEAIGKLVEDFSNMVDALKKLDSMTFNFNTLGAKMLMVLSAFQIMSASAWSAIIPALFGGPGALESFANAFDKMADALSKLNQLSLDAEKINPAIDKIVQVFDKMGAVKVDWTQIFGGADQMEKYGPILSDMATAFQQIQDLSLDLDGVDAAIDKIVQVLEKMSLAASRSNSLHIDAFFGLIKMDYGGGADNFTKFAAAIKPMADALNEISGLELSDKYEANLETLKNFIEKVKEWGTTGMFNEWGTDVWFKSAGADTFMRLGIGIKDMAEGLNVAKDALAGMGDPNQIGSYISGLQGFIGNLVGEIQKLSSIPGADKGASSLKDVLGSFKDLGEGLQSISSINFDGMGDDTGSLEDKITRLKDNLTNVFKLFTEKQEGQDKSFVEQFQDEKIKTAMEQMGSVGQTLMQLTSPLQQINSMDIDTGGVSEKLGTISTFIGDMMNTMNSSFDVKGMNGNKIGEIDPKAMSDRIESFKHMAEAIEPMVNSLGGISGNQLSTEQFTTVTDGLKNLFTEMGKLVGLGGEGQNGLFTGAGTPFNTVNDQVNAFKTFGESISSIMTGMSGMGTVDVGAFEANITQIKNFMTELWQNAEELKKGAETLKELSNALNGDEGNGFIEAIKKLGENFDIEGEGGINGKIQSMLNKLNEIPGKLAEVGGQIEASDFPNKVGTLIDNALQGINSKQGEFGTAAHNLLQAMQNEVDASVGWLTGMGTNAIAAKIVDGINAASVDVSGLCSSIESSLTKYSWQSVGESVVSGFAQGLYATSEVTRKAEQVARDALEAAKNALDAHSPSRKAAEIGGWFSEGFAEGILDNTPLVYKAYHTLANDAVNASVKTFSVNSPAKEFYKIGEYCAAGLALGIQSESDRPVSESIKMATETLQVCSDIFKNAEQDGFAPSITPVISMSDVQADVDSLSAMLSPQSLTPRLSTNLGLEAVTEQNISLQNDAVVDEVSKLRSEVQTYTEAVLTHIGSTYIDGISVNDNDAIHDTFIEMLYDLKRRAAMNGGR